MQKNISVKNAIAIIDNFLAELETKAKNNKAKYIIFEYVKREYFKDFELRNEEFIKFRTDNKMIIISKENNSYYLFLSNVGKKRIEATYINLYGFYKNIESKNIKKLLNLAIEKAIENYNRKFNKNITINDIKVVKKPTGHIVIQEPFYEIVAEKDSFETPNKKHELNIIKFEFE